MYNSNINIGFLIVSDITKSYAGQDCSVLFFHPKLNMGIKDFIILKKELLRNNWKIDKYNLVFYKKRKM